MNKSKTYLTIGLLASLALVSNSASQENKLSGSVALTNNYVARGMAQNYSEDFIFLANAPVGYYMWKKELTK